MNPTYFGDSYDLVKRFLADSAHSLGYSVFIEPMFTGDWPTGEREAFLRLVGSDIHDGASAKKSVLLLDPDKGVREAPSRVHATFAAIAKWCDHHEVVFAFDQSFSRNARVDDELQRKLRSLQQLEIHAFYYNSHARFLFCSRNLASLKAFHAALVKAALPQRRFVWLADRQLGK
jgi:hypothetical protein